MKRFLLMAAVVAWLGLAAASQSYAESIVLYNTGVNASGTPLPNGSADPHYSLLSAPYSLVSPPLGYGNGIQVFTSAEGYPLNGPYWNADDALSAWIGPNVDEAWGLGGQYDYQTSFALPGPGTLTITGQWSTDDQGVNILLSGNSSGNITPDHAYSYWTPFTITGTAGTINTLDFIVNNDAESPTGLRVEMTGSFTPASVPEPSSLVGLLGSGLFGLMGFVWRKRK